MTRLVLPNRRHAERLRFYHNGTEFAGTLGYVGIDDPLPSEIFLEGGKAGSSLQALCRDVAVIVSIALQHGTPLELMRQAITRLDREADGADEPVAAGPGGMLLDLIAKTERLP